MDGGLDVKPEDGVAEDDVRVGDGVEDTSGVGCGGGRGGGGGDELGDEDGVVV